MFEAFYGSFWQHPVLLLLLPVWFAFRLPRRIGFLSLYFVSFVATTIMDAILTSPFLGSNAILTALAIFFVIIGDLRYFALTEHLSGAPGTSRAWVRAGLLSLVVPVLQAALGLLVPAWFTVARHTFLAYEILFLVFGGLYHVLVLERRTLPTPILRWLRQVTGFVLVYYALWVTADVLILSGSDFGYLVRVVPNILYYGALLPFIWLTAPPEARGA